MACVQFNHRTLAYVTYTVASLLFWSSYFNPVLPSGVRIGLLMSYILVNYQLANGVSMILNGVPLSSGLLHQVGFEFSAGSDRLDQRGFDADWVFVPHERLQEAKQTEIRSLEKKFRSTY